MPLVVLTRMDLPSKLNLMSVNSVSASLTGR